jgi:hypothetical protein
MTKGHDPRDLEFNFSRFSHFISDLKLTGQYLSEPTTGHNTSDPTDISQGETQPSSRYFDTHLSEQHVSLTIGDFSKGSPPCYLVESMGENSRNRNESCEKVNVTWINKNFCYREM